MIVIVSAFLTESVFKTFVTCGVRVSVNPASEPGETVWAGAESATFLPLPTPTDAVHADRGREAGGDVQGHRLVADRRQCADRHHGTRFVIGGALRTLVLGFVAIAVAVDVGLDLGDDRYLEPR